MAVEIKSRKDILMPNVKLVPHENGGWALPGGGVTRDPLAAVDLARRLEAALGRDKPYNEADCLAQRLAGRAKDRS